jgi:hypothetical protein
MRNIKTYEGFFDFLKKKGKGGNKENKAVSFDVIENVKDILLPISDMGYDISVTRDNENLVIRVVSWGDQSLLITDEVKEEFMRMKDYLESEGFNSIEAHYYTMLNGKFVKELDEFINVKAFSQTMGAGGAPISNLLFSAKKIL